jgi:hypothetical protein
MWKADRTTISAAIVLVLAGFGRIAFAHDLMLGGASIGLGIHPRHKDNSLFPEA